MNIAAILLKVAPAIFKVIDDFVEDKDLSSRLKHELSTQIVDSQSQIARAAADVVVAEIQGESWLQRNWRPLLMVWFSILIGGYWFGFVPINMPVAIVEQMFTLVQIGIGGYVVGRSGEKIAKAIGPALLKGS